MNNPTVTPSTYCKIVFVEGSTDERLVAELIKTFTDSMDYQIINYKGIPQLKSRLDLFYKEVPSFNEHPLLKKIYITIDADKDAQKAFNNVTQHLKELNEKYPHNTLPIPKVMNDFVQSGKLELGIYVFPNNRDNGCLESLLLKTVTKENLYNITKTCADEIIKCYDTSLKATFSQQEYMRYLLYIDSIRVNYAHDYNKGVEVGLDFKSNALEDVRKFLKS